MLRRPLEPKKAKLTAKRPKPAKLVANPRLHAYVQKRLSGQISRPDGTVISGPPAPRWTGNNKPHRKDRAWVQAWSPEQIANRIKLDFPDDESMRISHEAIYQSLYIEGRGALKRELVWCLRTGRALWAPRERSRHKHTVKKGPALGGYGAIAMKNALANTMAPLPEQLVRSLTWGRGKEMSAHAHFSVETTITVFFADAQWPWQRGTNENTNGVLRQYFPKSTDLSRWSAEEIEAVAHALNTRPRRTLGWKTPAEAFNEQLLLLQQAGVASTG